MKMLQQQQAPPIVTPVAPGEPMLTIVLNGQRVSFPARQARTLLFHCIPEWLRDSTVDPPEPDPLAKKSGLDKGLLSLMRSGIKGLVRIKLPVFMRGIYGSDLSRWPPGVHLPQGREDILPMIDLMLVDFAITQAYYHPLQVEYDEATGVVTQIRPGQWTGGVVDARNPARAPSQGRTDPTAPPGR